MDLAEASGKTVDDALNRALAQIGANRDDVDKERVRFEVLDEGKKGGLFGRGGRDATVRVERLAASPAPRGGDGGGRRGGRQGQGQGQGQPRAEGRDRGGRGGREGGRSDAPRGARGPRQSQTRTGFEQPAPRLTDADFVRAPQHDGDGSPQEGERQPRQQPARGRQRGERAQGAPDGEREPRGERRERRHREDQPEVKPDIHAEEVDFAAETVDDLLRMLEIPADLNIREPLTAGDGLGSALAVIDIKGEDLGLLIGRRGDTLLSLQYLVNLIVSRKFPGRGGVTIDVEHYRHRNEERIISLAKRMAERVRESGAPITLEPMSASERRLIHMTFADDPDLETNSIGEGDNRKVVISARH